MFKFNIFACIIIQIIINCSLIFCNEDVNNLRDQNVIDSTNDDNFNKRITNDENFDERIYQDDSEEEENLIDPHSLYYDRRHKKVIKDVKVTRSEPDVLKPSQGHSVLKSHGDNCDTLKVYYKRLILMLLSNANLKVEDDVVSGQLFIKGTSSQIETLKKLNIEDCSVKDIDSILSQIILKSSYFNYYFDMPNLSEVTQSLANFFNNNVEAIIFICCVLSMVILSRVMSLFHAIFFILLALFMISFYMTWCHLIKEAEIKLAVSQVRHMEMPAACRPQNMHVWDRIKSYFFDAEECKIYLESRMSNPKLQVTPFFVLSHLISSITMHPLGQFGEVISKFINNSTAHLNWLKGPVQVMLYLLLPAFFVILVIYLRGGSFNFGLGLFRFSVSTHEPTPIPDTNTRRTIELIREVFAELPINTVPSITATNKSAPLSINDQTEEQKKENSIPTDDLIIFTDDFKFIESVPNESEKESDLASGDFVQQKLLPNENKKTPEKYTESSYGKVIEAMMNEHFGGGDA